MNLAPYVLPALLALSLGAADPKVRLLNPKVTPGGVAVVVTEAGMQGEVHVGDRRHAFFPAPGPRAQGVALVPMPFDAPPGPTALRVHDSKGTLLRTLSLTVKKASFPMVNLKVAGNTVHPSEAEKARIAKEAAEFKRVTADPAPTRLWEAPFIPPVKSLVTCVFGTTRRFNGEVKSVHKGIDLRAATGTPVLAPAAGTVRIAQDCFYGGNLVFIDHGLGLFSFCCHMSRLDVKVGQRLAAGDLLGLSGATGRASAPHLHWGASIGGVDVDPGLLREAMALAMGQAPPKPLRRKG